MLSTPVMTTEVERFSAKCRHSMGVTVFELQDDSVGHGLHAQHSDFLFYQLGDYQLAEAAEVRVHYVQRHLRGIEMKAELARDFEHVQMNVRVLVSSEADIAHFAGFTGFDQGGIGAVFIENAVGIFIAQDFVMLDQIDVIGLQALE